MATFWRPFLGRLSELWCRCDVCAISGPALRFSTFMNPRGEHIQLCELCKDDPDIQRAIQAGKRWKVLDV